MEYREEKNEELAATMREAARQKSLVGRIKTGLALGLELRQAASDLRFDGLPFYTVLALSVFKDVVDVLTFSVSGWITVPFVSLPLFLVFFMRKSRFKRFLIRKFFGKYIMMAMLEMFPGTSIFPFFTVSAILLKLRVDKEVRAHNSEADSVEQATAQLAGARA